MYVFSKKVSVRLAELDRRFYEGSLCQQLKQIATWKDSISLELAIFPTVIKDGVGIIESATAADVAKDTGRNPFTQNPFSQADIHAEKVLTYRKNDAIGNFLSDLIAFCKLSKQSLDKVFKDLKELPVPEKSGQRFGGDLKEIIGALTDSQKACELLRELSELQTIVEDEGLMPVVVALHSTLSHIEARVSDKKWEVINKKETEFIKVFLECFTRQTLLSWDQGLADLLSKEKEDTESGKQLFFLILEIFDQLPNYKKEITEVDLTKTLQALSESLEARVEALEDCDKGRTIPLLIKARDFPMIQAKMLDIVTTKVNAGTRSLEVELEDALDVSLQSKSAVVRVASAKCVWVMLGKDDYCDQVIDLIPDVREMFLEDIFTPKQVLEDDVLNFLDVLLISSNDEELEGDRDEYINKVRGWLDSSDMTLRNTSISIISHWSNDEGFRKGLVGFINHPALFTSKDSPELEEENCRFISNMSNRNSIREQLIHWVEHMGKYLSPEELFLQEPAVCFFERMSRHQNVRRHLHNYIDSMRMLFGNDERTDKKLYKFLVNMCLSIDQSSEELSALQLILNEYSNNAEFLTQVNALKEPGDRLKMAKLLIECDEALSSSQVFALAQINDLIDSDDHRALLQSVVPKVEALSKDSGELSEPATLVLSQLSKYPDSRTWLDKENSEMITFSDHDSDAVITNKYVFIVQVCDEQVLVDHLASNPGRLKKVLDSHSDDTSIHAKLLGVLVNLSRNDESLKTLFRFGKVLKKFVFSHNQVLREHAIEFMANMSVHDAFTEKSVVQNLVERLVKKGYWGSKYGRTDFMKNQIRFLLNSIDRKQAYSYGELLTSKLDDHSFELKDALASLSEERAVAIARFLLHRAQKEEIVVLGRAVEILETVCDKQETDDGYKELFNCSNKLLQSNDMNLRRFGFKAMAKAAYEDLYNAYLGIRIDGEAARERCESSMRNSHNCYNYMGYLTYFNYDHPDLELEKCLMFANLTNRIDEWNCVIKEEACQIHYMGSKLTHENVSIKRSAVQFLSNMSKLSHKQVKLRDYIEGMRAFSEDEHEATRGYVEAFLENMGVPVKRKAREAAGSGSSKKHRGSDDKEKDPSRKRKRTFKSSGTEKKSRKAR